MTYITHQIWFLMSMFFMIHKAHQRYNATCRPRPPPLPYYPSLHTVQPLCLPYTPHHAQA